jgi:plastocyanin
VVAAAGACDLDKDEPATPQGPVLTAIEYKFAPAEITIGATGQVTLRFNNQGEELHNLSIPDISADIDYQPNTGDNVIFVPPGAGRLEFFCKYHRDRGMTGAFIVQ